MQKHFRNKFNNKKRRFNNNRPKRSNKNGGRGSYIDPQLFVKKAVPQTIETQQTDTTFRDFKLSEKLQSSIEKNTAYKTPTPIQSQGIPLILEGKDVIGLANTGTGKTAAFLLPLINKILQDRSETVLIIAPTRELAVQINEELKTLKASLKMNSVVCIGGASRKKQIDRLKRNNQFVIGTPGRLKDLVRQKAIRTSEFQSAVLDEVDMMLDMGFLPDVKYILSQLPEKKQMLFFSATLPQNMKKLAESFLVNPITISVQKTKTSANVDQDVVRIGNQEKIEVLHNLLIQEEFRKVLVFGRTKWGVEKNTRQLVKKGHRIASIHGNKNQNQRRRALDGFRKNQVDVLFATDIAARGLDINNVSHVINFDLPESYETYIHRIGRTGRADRKGTALTFIK